MSLNSRHNPTAAAVLMVSWGMLLLGSGCASNAILVRNMPQEWRAQPVSNAQTVALSKLASATIPQDLIAEGDIVTVEITVGLRKEDNASVVLRVKDGAVDPPNIGPVQVVGLTTQEAEGVIRTAAIQQDVYKNPSVTVDLTRPKLNRITVTGAVNTPKTVELRPGNSDLLQAITAAGGLAKEAGTIVEIQHPGYQPGSTAGGRMPAIAENTADGVISASGESVAATPTAAKSIKVDLASLGEQKVSIPTLADGTVIWVEKQDPLPVKVDGLVRHPGHYPIPVGENLTVLDAISLAQGMSSQVADKIFVIRRRPGVAEPQLFQVSYSRAKRVGSENILLQPGDIVAVEQTPATVVLDVLKMATFGIQGRLF